ncbi:MAG: hypothetical protein WDM70_05215 [Nitrosomonadales bacterium]
MLTEAQLLAQASLGVSLSEQEAAVFAYLTRKGQIDLADVKGLTGLAGPGSPGTCSETDCTSFAGTRQ